MAGRAGDGEAGDGRPEGKKPTGGAKILQLVQRQRVQVMLQRRSGHTMPRVCAAAQQHQAATKVQNCKVFVTIRWRPYITYL